MTQNRMDRNNGLEKHQRTSKEEHEKANKGRAKKCRNKEQPNVADKG
jgi:hypothetical protein